MSVLVQLHNHLMQLTSHMHATMNRLHSADLSNVGMLFTGQMLQCFIAEPNDTLQAGCNATAQIACVPASRHALL